MRRFVTAMAVMGLVLVGCGGSATSCESIADEGIDRVQELMDSLEDMSIDELIALGDEEPEALSSFQSDFDALQTKADESGCTDSEMEDLFSTKVGDLEAKGPVGELFLEGFRSEIGG